jgi:hypothetical protein
LSLLNKNNFYVYRYVRLDTKRPYYVGKGSNRRAYNIKSHNRYCNYIHELVGSKIEIVAFNISETLAFELESTLIRVYKMYGMAEANFDPGGRGNAGRISPMKGRTHSLETKLKISIGNSGKVLTQTQKDLIKKSLSNRTRSAETRSKISLSKLGKPSPHRGKIYSAEIRNKMSIAHIGKTPWNKGLKK